MKHNFDSSTYSREDIKKITTKGKNQPAVEPQPLNETSRPMLRDCPDCGKNISVSALTCPHCGRPLKSRYASGIFKFCRIAIIIWTLLWIFFSARAALKLGDLIALVPELRHIIGFSDIFVWGIVTWAAGVIGFGIVALLSRPQPLDR